MARPISGDDEDNIKNLDLKMKKETLNLEIQKELKFKEEADKQLKACIDRKERCTINTVRKNCGKRLTQMYNQLAVLHTHLPEDDGE